MRLLNTETLELKELRVIPLYAILSHRWEDEEVSFEEYTLLNECDDEELPPYLRKRAHGTKQKRGYKKILDFCAFAKARRLEWAWIDICCIDKRSSAELSEAINSMWKWYEDAWECYVYSSDVPSAHRKDPVLWLRFSRSEWFGRGWTLQELLAPSILIFCTQDWEIFDTLKKARRGWADLNNVGFVENLASITRIPSKSLVMHDFHTAATVAQRMTWAARRATSRVEDTAYCLLGLFSINMPLLYGEGSMAFIRLLKEIIALYNDQTILAWKDPCTKSSFGILPTKACTSLAILAPSPDCFEFCGHVGKAVPTGESIRDRPITIADRRLEFEGYCTLLT